MRQRISRVNQITSITTDGDINFLKFKGKDYTGRLVYNDLPNLVGQYIAIKAEL